MFAFGMLFGFCFKRWPRLAIAGFVSLLAVAFVVVAVTGDALPPEPNITDGSYWVGNAWFLVGYCCGWWLARAYEEAR